MVVPVEPHIHTVPRHHPQELLHVVRLGGLAAPEAPRHHGAVPRHHQPVRVRRGQLRLEPLQLRLPSAPPGGCLVELVPPPPGLPAGPQRLERDTVRDNDVDLDAPGRLLVHRVPLPGHVPHRVHGRIGHLRGHVEPVVVVAKRHVPWHGPEGGVGVHPLELLLKLGVAEVHHSAVVVVVTEPEDKARVVVFGRHPHLPSHDVLGPARGAAVPHAEEIQSPGIGLGKMAAPPSGNTVEGVCHEQEETDCCHGQDGDSLGADCHVSPSL
mmetsp:Transcript_21269/g.67331  ORF Transcript_21269/g.67331 Transcript_21269/m.67331 type:complete len:268 (-) Transcript_21269:530-1333(-)